MTVVYAQNPYVYRKNRMKSRFLQQVPTKAGRYYLGLNNCDAVKGFLGRLEHETLTFFFLHKIGPLQHPTVRALNPEKLVTLTCALNCSEVPHIYIALQLMSEPKARSKNS
jgi:hypothetical protein